MNEKFIGFFRLLSACRAPRCPICACLAEDNRRALDAILHDHVTDPETRRELYAAWGFCNWHATTLVGGSGGVTGAAILFEDLLRRCGERFTRCSPLVGRPPSLWARLAAAVTSGWSRPASVVDEYTGRSRCRVCVRLAQSGRVYVAAVVRFADDDEFTTAYAGSVGLCVPHLAAVVAEGRGAASVGALVGTTLRKWDALRADLSSFVRKHEYRATEAINDAEAEASRRAAEALTGLPHLFGNDLPRAGRIPET